MAEFGEHICEVCGVGMFSHPEPNFAITTRFWSNPGFALKHHFAPKPVILPTNT